jgi:hypothetical protein
MRRVLARVSRAQPESVPFKTGVVVFGSTVQQRYPHHAKLFQAKRLQDDVSRQTRPLKWVLALAICAFTSNSAMAQTQAQCTNLDKLGDTQLRVTQQYGRALVELTRPNSAGRKVEIEYGDESYIGKFERDGRARLGFALTDAKNEISIRLSETPTLVCKIEVPEFAKIFRVILRWRDAVQLDLHVIEPGRRLGEFGHVSPARPNTNFAQGLGQMDVVSGVPTDGATAESSYVVPDASAIPADSVFGFRAEYVTRGMKPQPPHCDDHPLAAPPIELIVIDKGKVTARKMATNRAPCGEALAENRRYMTIRP